MAVFKCKMCGGDIRLEDDKTFGTCEYCGSTMTFPKVSDEQRTAAFNRGNHFRRIGEFDKALAVYERIVAEDDADAEAHWCCALCRFGIEYVEDPTTYEWLPTCHRASFDSFLEDVDYLAALEHSDGITRRQYQKDAAKIAEVQRGILATSQNTEPYDVFISYKELDEQGNRTRDSILAQDIYYQLTEKGWRVFFSRISLEDVPGTQYEPYIFAALNSAKVMVVVGTSAENLNAVWVKNEWSRYLSLMRKDRSKLLLPCYRDMDPYDLPEQLSVLMSYDMGKIGFIQDLIRGVDKVLSAEQQTERQPVKEVIRETVTSAPGAGTAPLLRRAIMFLEDGDWKRADDFCEQVLNLDPENAQAYLGKLMAELHVCRKEDLKNCPQPFGGSNNYRKAVRFGNEALKKELDSANAFIIERNENERLTGIYDDAIKAMNAARTEDAFKKAAEKFRSVREFRDSASKEKKCLEQAETCRKNDTYDLAKAEMVGENEGSISSYERAMQKFQSISGWKDADKQVQLCKRRIEEIKLEERRREEQERIDAEKAVRKRKKILAITIPATVVLVAFLVILTNVIIPNNRYASAVDMFNSKKYQQAYELFSALGEFKDSEDMVAKCERGLIIEQIRTKAVGSTFYFGSYEQDNDTSNGKEDIEWIILEKDGNKRLLISKYALDCQPYHLGWPNITWETCSLRSWLNGYFLKNAFSSDERNQIMETEVLADKNPKFSTYPGNSTKDKVFLLSIPEVNRYFFSDTFRACQGTTYCNAQGAAKASNGNCRWWLRSPGGDSNNAAYVDTGGLVYCLGNAVEYKRGAVRPALWIDLGD